MELLFIVVGAGFVSGVAGIKPAQAGVAALFDLQQQGENAKTALGEVRLKERIDAGCRPLADIEETCCDEAFAFEHPDHSAFAGAAAGIGPEEVFERFRYVAGEALLVAQEHVAQVIVHLCLRDFTAEIGILFHDPALAFAEGAGFEIDAQRRDGMGAAVL